MILSSLMFLSSSPLFSEINKNTLKKERKFYLKVLMFLHTCCSCQALLGAGDTQVTDSVPTSGLPGTETQRAGESTLRAWKQVDAP